MIPEIGHYALILALCVAVVLGSLPIYGAAVGNSALMSVAKPAARGQFILVLLAFCCLAYAFAAKDFSVLYVASTSNSQLPLQYRLAAIWGAHEGSLLLWVFILSIWMVAVSFFSTHLPEAMRARILGVMGLISVGFLLFMLTVSNPFERLIPAAFDGRDLNPLLQDPGMVIHPPTLYMGYVGFSVAFAFAIAALLGGNLDAAMDHRGLDLPDARHHAGFLVGVPRAGLGRLVVLGSGRKCLVHALAGGNGVDSLAGGHR